MSKVIFKMTFKHPNRTDTKTKNVSHIGYISNRPGVDKTVTEADLKKELEKGTGDLASSDENYVQYIDERPRSHGLFGPDGLEDPTEIQEEIGEVESFVWRGIISLKEDDAKELGYLDKDKWQDMLRARVPEMAEKMGIRPSNLRWVAAVHMEKGHPHSHVVFWEKEPERTIGIVKPRALDDIRKMYTDEIFEDQRLELLNEKNAMRDLIKDFANDDISKISKMIKDVYKAGKEISETLGTEGMEKPVGIAPKLYTDEEVELIAKIKELGESLPGRGRIALKFMPTEVKEQVREIADYLLKQPGIVASVEKNLRATEELTKMYTGKEEDILKARENAYNDIRDRVSQTILKGAAESQRKNIFYVDKELSNKAIQFIKEIDSQINLVDDYKKVASEIIFTLDRLGHNQDEIKKCLNEFFEKENLSLDQKTVDELIGHIDNQNKNNDPLAFKRNIEQYLSILKLSGYEEASAFNIIKRTVEDDSKSLDNRLIKLSEDGILKKEGEIYKLTDKGIEEFLKVKQFDKVEQELFKSFNKENNDVDNVKELSFDELIENKDIFDRLYNKDSEEFKLGRYDLRVRDIFGEDNKITFKELEENIYKKYMDDEYNINTEKADIEIELLENRINKLTLNGYIKLDRETGIYSFTDETEKNFMYDQEKEGHYYTEEAAAELEINKFEFTRYDASVTLSYLDKAENNIIDQEELRDIVEKEIVNKQAQDEYESIVSVIESGQAEAYISISEDGDIESTEQGQELSRVLNGLNKYFYSCKGNITEEKLYEYCKKEYGDNGEQQAKSIIYKLDLAVKKGYVNKEKDKYTIEPTIKPINKLLYQLYKEDGKINKDDLKSVLEKNIPNKEAKRHFEYILKRLDGLKKEGYLLGQDGGYQLSNKGIEKRKDILTPQRDILRGKIEYLKKLGLIENSGEKFIVTPKYYSHMKNISDTKDLTASLLEKDIINIIDRTQDKINVGKIERSNERIIVGKYINNEYCDIESSYDSIRKSCNVPDTIEKTLRNLSTTLGVSRVSLEEAKEILYNWNIKTDSKVETEKIDNILNKSYENIKENDLWGKVTILSTKDWKEMFSSLGFKDEQIPKWIYKGENWQSFNQGSGLSSLVNEIWKAAWKQIEIERMKTQSQVQYMKKQLLKQQSEQSKSAMVEQARKNKDRGSMYQDDFEI